MKKISTLFMALALVLGVSAAPVFRPVEKKIEKHDLATDVQLAAPSLNAPAVSMGYVNNLRTAAISAPAKKEGAELLAPAKKVAAPKQAALADVSDSIGSATALYLGSMTTSGYGPGDWEILFYTPAGKFIGFMDFSATDSLHIGGTFTISNGELVIAAGDTAAISGSLTLTCLSVLGNYPTYSVVGQFTDMDSRTHTFNAEIPVRALSYYYYGMYMHYMDMYDQYAPYCQYLGMYCDEVEQIYNLAIEAYEAAPIKLEDMEFVPTGDVVDIEFEGFMKDAGTYAGKPYTDFWAFNADSSYYFRISLLANPLEEGLYDQTMMDMSYTYLNSYADSTRVNFEDISAIVSFDGDTVFIDIEGALGKNGVEYNITFKYFIPQPEETIHIFVPDGKIKLTDEVEDNQYFRITAQGWDADIVGTDTVKYAISLMVEADTLVGDFADSLISKSTDYTYVAIFVTDSTIMKYSRATASLHTELNATEDTLLVHYEYFGANKNLYILDAAISLVLPEALDTVYIVAPASFVKLTDDRESYYREFIVEGQGFDIVKYQTTSQLEMYQFQLNVYNTDSLEGEFGNKQIYNSLNYTFVGKFVTDSTYMKIDRLDAKATTQLVGANKDTLAVTFEYFGADRIRYVVLAEVAVVVPDPYELDAEDNVADSFEKSEVTITDYTASDGLILVTAEKADGSARMGLIVYTNVADLMPGTYPIDTITTAPGHVLASIGEQDGSFYYSFYETLIDGDFDEVWFFTGGSVTVSATEVVINAVNSKGATATITINLLPTGIEDIKVDSKLNDVQKLLDGGKLIILRNSKFFDAAGRLVK